jgi:hypothetical protein
MCAPGQSHQHPDDRAGGPAPDAVIANWRQPGSLRWKVQRTLINTSIKIVRRQRCCGNGGEPGC